MIMVSIQYFIYFIIIQTISSFVPYELGSNGDIFKYNGDKSSSTTSSSRSVDEISSIPSANSYYSTINSSSSPLIDFMRTLYEQEKINRLQSDYNLIRALAPRIGKNMKMKRNFPQLFFFFIYEFNFSMSG